MNILISLYSYNIVHHTHHIIYMKYTLYDFSYVLHSTYELMNHSIIDAHCRHYFFRKYNLIPGIVLIRVNTLNSVLPFPVLWNLLLL